MQVGTIGLDILKIDHEIGAEDDLFYQPGSVDGIIVIEKELQPAINFLIDSLIGNIGVNIFIFQHQVGYFVSPVFPFNPSEMGEIESECFVLFLL